MISLSQFSIRELLCALLFAGLGLAALKAGGVLAAVVMFLAIVLVMGMAIVALVGRRELRAYGIGFLVPLVVYGGVVWIGGKSELDPYEGKLPTANCLRPLYEVLVQRTWRSRVSGEVITDIDPQVSADPFGRGEADGFGGPFTSLTENPNRHSFMLLGHLLIGMLFAYAGARFAVAVQREGTKGSGLFVSQIKES